MSDKLVHHRYHFYKWVTLFYVHKVRTRNQNYAQLRDLCRRYGLKPTGNGGYKTSWIVTLMAFPQIALAQLRQGRGLKSPGFSVIQFLEGVVDEMNSPTDEQAALIKLTMERKVMSYPIKRTY
ncbi:hypothetical protein [Nostoc sp. NMS7]|uniref:hypothetical protein n=1 Tax=Nostoc sp. NMS7 TaxID=2815391 RepID=UPI0034586D95